MRKIVLNLAVTLDGFIEGPNGEIDWCNFEDNPGSESFFDKFLPTIGSIFYGRVSYDLWGQYQPGESASDSEKKLWATVHGKEKYVFSRKQRTDDKASFIQGDIITAVNNIKNKPGKDIWLYGGANLITGFINLGLVDSFQLAVFPVILGLGKPLFSDIKNRVGLQLINVETSASGVVLLHYNANS